MKAYKVNQPKKKKKDIYIKVIYNYHSKQESLVKSGSGSLSRGRLKNLPARMWKLLQICTSFYWEYFYQV